MNHTDTAIRSLALGLVGLLGLASCGGEGAATAGGGEGAEGPAAETPSSEPVALEGAVRELRCGCKIDGIGSCGNYVAVDDSWLEISNPDDHGLGHMEWCAVDIKVEATVTGTRSGGMVHVDSMELASK